jgi:hypothetical protein
MKTYDPKQVQVVVGGVPIQGYADGTFIRVGRRNVAWEMVTGADGESARAKSNDNSGFIEIELMQTSSSNQHLSNIANADELSNAGVVPIMVKDNSGFSLHVSEQSFIEKKPDAAYAKTNQTRVWRFLCENLQDFHGGN